MPSQSKNRAGSARQRTAQARRDRAAQLREERARQERRGRMMRSGGIVGAVVAVIVIVVVVGLVTKKHPKSGTPTSTAPATAVQQASSVPASVFAQVGAGSASAAPKTVSGQPVADTNGHPTVLFVGAEWCPYCATERWPMVVALSRFGTFSNLGRTASSPSDTYPNTQTFSLHGATYTSQYLSLDAKELQSNQVTGGHYASLDTLTSAEQANFKKAGGGFPYINLGGKYTVGTQLNPALLQGKTMEQIAAALSDPTSDIAKAIDGAANLFTAGLCTLTNNQPASVCTAAPIPSLESQIGGS